MKESKIIRIIGNILLIIYASIILTLYFSNAISHTTLKDLIFAYWFFRCCIYELSVHLIEADIRNDDAA